MKQTCELSLSINPRIWRTDVDGITKITSIITSVQECRLDINVGIDTLSAQITGRCTAAFNDEGRCVSGRCLKHALRMNGTYVGGEGGSCSHV